VLKEFDADASGELSKGELKLGLIDYGCPMTDRELRAMFEHLDMDKSGHISFREFLDGLSPPMTQARVDVATEAFRKVDASGDGTASLDELRAAYDVKRHPEVVAGTRSEAQALRDFVSQFKDADKDGDGLVALPEFLDYYHHQALEDDAYFDEMVRGQWHLGGGAAAEAAAAAAAAAEAAAKAAAAAKAEAARRGSLGSVGTAGGRSTAAGSAMLAAHDMPRPPASMYNTSSGQTPRVGGMLGWPVLLRTPKTFNIYILLYLPNRNVKSPSPPPRVCDSISIRPTGKSSR